MKKRMATRVSVICATIAALLRELPDQPLRAQVIDLADDAVREVDILISMLEPEIVAPARRSA